MSAVRKAALGWGAAMLGGLAVIAATVSDYGISWDEPEQCRYAERTIAYFLSLGADRRCNDLMFMKYNNPFVDLVAALLYLPSPRHKYEVRHLVCAVLALATVPAVFRFGRRLGGDRAGILGALFLVTTPQFYGHAFVNTKDVPFACFFAWTMDSLASLLLKDVYRLRDFLSLGLFAGLTAAVRPGGLVVVSAIVLLAIGSRALAPGPGRGFRRLPGLFAGLFAAGVLAWAVMIVPWPWAHENLLLHPLRAIRVASSFPNVLPVLFNGRVAPSNQLPWYYLLEFLLITTPLPTLGLGCLGMAVGMGRVISGARGATTSVVRIGLLWSILPVAIWTATRSNIYDGLRHFLFVLPSISFWAGYGGAWLWGLTAARPFRALTTVGLCAAVLWPVVGLVRLHPYQMTYYNETVGGVRGASGRFETEYWMTSYKEAIEWVNGQARRSGRTVGVAVAALDESVVCARFFCDPGVVIRQANVFRPIAGPLPPGIDYYVSTVRYRLDRNYPDSPVVKRVGREGATFTVVKGRSSP